jgi:hypothetical protein
MAGGEKWRASRGKAARRVGTYAFREVGAGEEAVACEAVEVCLHLHPGVVGLVAANEAEAAERLVRAGARAVELRALPSRGPCGEGGLDAGSRRRLLLLPLAFGAAVGAAEALGEVLRELARDGHGLRLELLRELQQPVRRGPPDRRRPRPRRRRRAAASRMVPARTQRQPRRPGRRGRLDAPKDNGVVLLQVERDLDQLLPVVGAAVGAPRRGARAERPRRRPRRGAPSLVVARGRRGGGAAPHRRAESGAAFQRGSRNSPMLGSQTRGARRRLDGWIWAGWLWNLWGKAPATRPSGSRADERGSATGGAYMRRRARRPGPRTSTIINKSFVLHPLRATTGSTASLSSGD